MPMKSMILTNTEIKDALTFINKNPSYDTRSGNIKKSTILKLANNGFISGLEVTNNNKFQKIIESDINNDKDTQFIHLGLTMKGHNFLEASKHERLKL